MKNLTWQNPEQLFVAQVLINKVKSKCCGIKVYYFLIELNLRFSVLTTKYFSKLFHFSNNLKYKQYKKKQIKPPIRIIAMKLIAEVKNCKANNDTKVSMISNAVINHHFGVVDFKGAQKDAMIKYYILYLESP